MTFLPRRVIGLVLVVCFAGTPAFLLACAVTCVPGMMTGHAMPAAAPDARLAAEASAHEHMHHEVAPEPSAPADAASPRSGATVAASSRPATSPDRVDRGCCDHATARATMATPASRADIAAPAVTATLATVITVPAVGAVGLAHAALVRPSFLSPPLRSPLVLRI